mgnify:CR=1 FL=1
MPETLSYTEIAEPEIIQATDIKVHIKAAGVNPVDTKIRRNGLLYPLPLPAILGCDGAGVITEVGSAVTKFKPGDSVWFCHGGLGREQGNYAEYNVLDQRWAGLMPNNLSFAQAAALPLVLITAYGALFQRGGLRAGQTVLIHAGAGGVGSVAIPLAKIAGAKVITTVSSQEKADWVKQLGADAVIFYQQQDLVTAVNAFTEGQGVDLTFDTVGPDVFAASIPVTKHFGRIVTLLDPGLVSLAEARVRNLLIGFELMLTPMLRDLPVERDAHVKILNQCKTYLEQGVLPACRVEILPLIDAALAHRAIETGHTLGKLVLVN